MNTSITSLITRLVDRLTRWLHVSPHIHIRARNVSTISDAVDLFDRFLDDAMKYDLEWDDFISWEHENVCIEAVRERLGNSEALLFSKLPTDRARYVAAVLAERNRLAAFVGRSPRGPHSGG